MRDFSIPKKIATLKTQVLVASAEKSPANLLTAVENLKNILPNCKGAILKGQDHNVAVKVLAPVLIDFFKN